MPINNKLLSWLLSYILLFSVYFFLPNKTHAVDVIDPWSATASLTQPTANHQSVTNNEYLVILAGSTLDDFSTIEKLNTSVTPQSWLNGSTNVPSTMYWHASSKKSNYTYTLGGTQYPPQTSKDFVYVGEINSSGDLQNWRTLSSLPTRLSKGAAAVVGDYIYFSGGYTDNENAGSASKKVYYALINADGSLGSWNTATDLPGVLWAHGMVAYGSNLYVIGGWNSSGITNQVWRATANSNGTLSAWTAMPNLPVSDRSMGVTIVDNYIFVVGGYNGNYLNSVYYTSLSSDGSMATWSTSSNSLPVNHCCGSLAAVGGYLYLTGGYISGPGYTQNVYKTKLNVGVPTPLTPVVVLPGMGASWNYEAIVHNTAVADTSWTLTPSITVYDGLITTLKNSGYVEGTNLWVYYYDWRKNISDTAASLASFITSKNLTSVNLIGHSQGGLIARAYAQSNPSKINKLVTIASPHAGALPAFKIWEGADFSDLPAWQNLLVKLYLRINRKSYANDVTTIQSKFPNLQNVLPTFEYFNTGTGAKSNFLNTLTANSLYTISGTNLNTPKTYNITPRGTFDKLVGKWVNGKPTGVTNALGDGTVLLTSGQVTGALENSSQDNQDHQAIVSNSVTLAKIQSTFGISGIVSTSTQSSLANALIITTASPVNFTVTTPANTTLTPSDNLLIVNNPGDGNYTVNITPNGAGGAYTVYFGKTKGNDIAWEETSSSITSGTKTHTFGVQMAQASLGSNPHSNALSHTNAALTAVGTNAILKQDVLRIRSYVNDLNTTAANVVTGFDLRARRLFSAVDTLTNKAKNTSVTESLRLLKSDIEQLRGDRFGN